MSTFLGTVNLGQIDWADPQSLAQWIATLEQQRVVVVIEPLRTNDQNAAFWALVGETAKHTGNDAKTVEHEFRTRFLVPSKDGERHTSTLSKSQFYEFLEQCTALALEYGVPIRQLAAKPGEQR